MPAPLDPAISQIIPLLPLRDPKTMTPQSCREALRALSDARKEAAPPPPVASVTDITVKGAAGPLPARVYRSKSGKAPTVVFFHGGGWVAGDLETHDRQIRWLAIETGAVVISVDYRRPPEVRFPGAFEDAFAAVRDVANRIAEFGGDTNRIYIGGHSAGGHLASLLIMNQKWLNDVGVSPEIIKGTIGLSGVYDMSEGKDNVFGSDPELRREAFRARSPSSASIRASLRASSTGYFPSERSISSIRSRDSPQTTSPGAPNRTTRRPLRETFRTPPSTWSRRSSAGPTNSRARSMRSSWAAACTIRSRWKAR